MGLIKRRSEGWSFEGKVTAKGNRMPGIGGAPAASPRLRRGVCRPAHVAIGSCLQGAGPAAPGPARPCPARAGRLARAQRSARVRQACGNTVYTLGTFHSQISFQATPLQLNANHFIHNHLDHKRSTCKPGSDP